MCAFRAGGLRLLVAAESHFASLAQRSTLARDSVVPVCVGERSLEFELRSEYVLPEWRDCLVQSGRRNHDDSALLARQLRRGSAEDQPRRLEREGDGIGLVGRDVQGRRLVGQRRGRHASVRHVLRPLG